MEIHLLKVARALLLMKCREPQLLKGVGIWFIRKKGAHSSCMFTGTVCWRSSQIRLAFKVLTSFYFLGRVFVCLLKAVFTVLKSLDIIHSCTSNSHLLVPGGIRAWECNSTCVQDTVSRFVHILHGPVRWKSCRPVVGGEMEQPAVQKSEAQHLEPHCTSPHLLLHTGSWGYSLEGSTVPPSGCQPPSFLRRR